MNRLLIITAIVSLLCGCKKVDSVFGGRAKSNLESIDISSGTNGIVAIPSTAHSTIRENFYWYTALFSQDGGRIHIIAQSDISEKQILRTKDILNQLLNPVANPSTTAPTKENLDNIMASSNATVALFNSQLAAGENETKLSNLNIDHVGLSSSDFVFEDTEEYYSNITQDQAFKKIAELIFKTGIKKGLPSYHNRISTAASNAIDNLYWISPSIPEWINDELIDQKYFGILTGVYYNFWAHETSGVAEDGTFLINSRASMQVMDPSSYQLMQDFYNDNISFNVEINNTPDDTTIYLNFNQGNLYSLKSQFLTNLTLKSNNVFTLSGNRYNNSIVGNDTINIYRTNGKFGEYNLNISNNKILLTDTVDNRNGIDQLLNFDFIEFADTTIAL